MAHINYYLDLCVETFVVNKGCVLLRMHDKYNIWTGPGGHIDPGEDPNEAALREVWEEVGLRVKLIGPSGWEKSDTDTNLDLVPPMFLNRHVINSTHEHSALIFVAVSESREVSPKTEADMGCEYRWVDRSEVEEMLQSDSRLRPEVYRYALTALDIVGVGN